MNSPSLRFTSGTDHLSEAMRSIRSLRRLTTKGIAGEMGIPIRTYEYFESGAGGVTYDRLRSFAEATNSDWWALMMALDSNSSELAERCANNKIALNWMLALNELHNELGGDIVYLRTGHISSVLGKATKKLVEYVRNIDPEAWM